MASVNEFKKHYIKAIQEGYAAVFAGAGLSRPAGFVDWKELLGDIAEDIGLDVDKEVDLVEVAQFYCNEKKSRAGINERILNRFITESQETESLDILAKMPIKFYWTTNYDHLIEDTLKNHGKRVDIKIIPQSLATTLSNNDAIVYKMHGDYLNSETCIITKDDYELYNENRQLFTTALQGDLVSKTFLFIGFSFEDPNLKYILSRIRVLLDKNQRTHYCFLEKIKKDKYKENINEYYYDLNKQNLRVNDLMRYGINVVLLDDYNEIPSILTDISIAIKTNCVFISGAANEYGDKWHDNGVNLIRELTLELFKANYKIVTGHARGIGSYIISSVLEKSNSNLETINKHLLIKAFPYEDKDRDNYDEIKYNYRKSIFQEAGISIFLFGNKKSDTDNNTVLAKGIYDEYKIAKDEGAYIIPIGSTGYMSEIIFKEVEKDIDNYFYLQTELNILRSSNNVKEIVKSVLIILKRIQNNI